MFKRALFTSSNQGKLYLARIRTEDSKEDILKKTAKFTISLMNFGLLVSRYLLSNQYWITVFAFIVQSLLIQSMRSDWYFIHRFHLPLDLNIEWKYLMPWLSLQCRELSLLKRWEGRELKKLLKSMAWLRAHKCHKFLRRRLWLLRGTRKTTDVSSVNISILSPISSTNNSSANIIKPCSQR